MSNGSPTPWYLRYPKRWEHFRAVPLSRLKWLLIAVYLLFSIFGFYADLMNGGTQPYLIVIVNVLMNGITSTLFIVVLARLPLIYFAIPIAYSAINPLITKYVDIWLMETFSPQPVPGDTGIRFAATGTVFLAVTSYVFFVSFIRSEGREAFRLRNELELAHGIQKTLVPPVSLRTTRFEVYGVSKPSEKVGGDLVDALELTNGDAIAYLADIAGHGLQAGILMGMLKIAARTALLEAVEVEPARTLPLLLDRLNSVLPEVKEPHMYATFTGFRLGADGSVYYALAASPPILHWHAGHMNLSHLEEEQFPLGLLPVPAFDGQRMQTAPGDLLVVATDGILEVSNKDEEEFGVERVKDVIAANTRLPLAELAHQILAAAQAFGKQLDDQTILIVRCL
jgi:serine phosphatase RsbU (regulator of sigma subunit)